MVMTSRRWDNGGCNEQVDKVCPLCEQAWDGPPNNWTLIEKPEYIDRNSNAIIRKLEDGKCIVCHKSYDGIYPHKPSSYPKKHIHCGCGTCLNGSGSLQSHYYKGGRSRGCKILYIKDTSNNDAHEKAHQSPRVEKRWDLKLVSCVEKVDTTCPLCLQKWESSIASRFNLDDHLAYKDADTGRIFRETEDGKCIVCKKTTSSYPNIEQQIQKGNTKLLTQHFHCCCGVCLEGEFITKHLLNTFGHGCRILFSKLKSSINFSSSESENEISFRRQQFKRSQNVDWTGTADEPPTPPRRNLRLLTGSDTEDSRKENPNPPHKKRLIRHSALLNTPPVKKTTTEHRGTQTQILQIYESSTTKRNRNLAGRLERQLRESIRCDDWAQFMHLVALYMEEDAEYTEDKFHEGYFPEGMLLFSVKHNRCKYIEVLVYKVSFKELGRALQFAVASNRCEVVRTFLCQINKEEEGWDTCNIYRDMKPSIFEIAIKRSLPEMTNTILDLIADFFEVDNTEEEPLYLAGFYGTISILEVIFSHTSFYKNFLTDALLGAYDNKQWTTMEWLLKQPHPKDAKLREDYVLEMLITKIIEDRNSKILTMLNRHSMLFINEEAMKLSQENNWSGLSKNLIESLYEKQK